MSHSPPSVRANPPAALRSDEPIHETTPTDSGKRGRLAGGESAALDPRRIIVQNEPLTNSSEDNDASYSGARPCIVVAI
jgi:hypothetical protein